MAWEVVHGEVMPKDVRNYLAGQSGNFYRIGSMRMQPLGSGSYHVETENGIHKVMIDAVMLDTLTFTAKEEGYGLLLTKNDRVKLEISEGENVVKVIDASEVDVNGIFIKAGQALRFVRNGSGYIGRYPFFMNNVPEMDLEYKTPKKDGAVSVDSSGIEWNSFI